MSSSNVTNYWSTFMNWWHVEVWICDDNWNYFTFKRIKLFSEYRPWSLFWNGSLQWRLIASHSEYSYRANLTKGVGWSEELETYQGVLRRWRICPGAGWGPWPPPPCCTAAWWSLPSWRAWSDEKRSTWEDRRWQCLRIAPGRHDNRSASGRLSPRGHGRCRCVPSGCHTGAGPGECMCLQEATISKK